MAETGGPRRYDSSSSLVKHAGMSPSGNASGAFAGQAHICRRGRPGLRLVVWRAVWPMLQHNPVMAARHQAMTRAADDAAADAGPQQGTAAQADPRPARQGPRRVRRLPAALDLLHGRPRHQRGSRRRLRCRGLSVRDVEAALAEALGDQAAISKSIVSAVCQQIKDEYQAWARRRLDQVTLDYLYLDASFFRMHPGSPAEPVLAAWGITTEGKPAFIGLAPGSGESADAWHDFLTDLEDRGLPSPLLIISDGAPGLIAAIEQAFPQALRQRCLIHRSRKEIMCCLGVGGLMWWYEHSGRGPRSAVAAVRGTDASSERAAAAVAAGD